MLLPIFARSVSTSTSRVRRWIRPVGLVAVLAAALWTSACDGDDPPTPTEIAETIAGLELDKQSLLMFVGDSADVVATVLSSSGSTIDPSSLPSGIVWSSTDQGVVIVAPDGVVRAVGAGTSTIVASLGDVSAAVVAVVREVPVALASITGRLVSGSVGDLVEGGVRTQIRDSRGNGVPGIQARFTVLSGGGTVSDAEVVTDSSGVARSEWTLGPAAGEQRLEIRALLSSGPAGAPNSNGSAGRASAVEDLVLVVTAVADPDPVVEVVFDPSDQTVAGGEAGSIAVSPLDAFGNLVPDETVTVVSSDPAVADPDAAGNFVGGVAGTTTLTGTLDSNASIVGQGTITVVAGAPSSLTKVSGDSQSANPGSVLPQPFTVEVKDPSGNPVSGVSVDWAVASGTGTLASVSAQTASDGRAANTLTLGVTPGDVEVTATVSGVGTVTFTASAVYPALAITTTALPQGTAGTAYSATVAATGGDGTYSWSLSGGPGWLSMSATGRLLGTAVSGIYNITVQVTSGDGQTASRVLTLNIDGLAITSTSLPGGIQGSAYSQTVVAVGGDSNYTFSISSGALPAGLALNATTGAITGTPSGTGTSSFTVMVQSGDGQTATRSLSISIVAPLVITTTTPLPGGAHGLAYSQTATATGGTSPYTWSLTGAPGWLSINASTGQMSGTAVAGTYNFDIGVSSSDGQSASLSVSLTISAGSALVITTTSLPTGVAGTAYASTVGAAGGDGNYTWSLTGAPVWLSIGATTGALSGTAVAGTFNFDVNVASGDGQNTTRSFTLTVHPVLAVSTTSLANGVDAVAYSQSVAATGGDGSYTWSISSGALPTGLSLNASSGLISGTPSATGTFNFDVQVVSGDGQTDTQALSINIFAVLNLTTTSLPDGQRNAAYNQTLTASGGDGSYTWSVSSGALPAGLSLSPTTGQITGTVGATGTFNFTAQVASGDGQVDTQALSIAVPPPSITTSSVPNGNQGVMYYQTLAAVGGDLTYTWSVSSGALPGGVTLDANTGILQGAPTATGTFNFTVQVNSAGDTDTQALSIVVGAAPYLIENFSTYTSTADMISDPRGIYDGVEDILTNRMELDQTRGVPPFTQSLRYNFPVAGVPGPTISRAISLVPIFPAQEVWVETTLRFDTNFTVEAGLAGGAAYKLLLMGIQGAAGRFGMAFENGDNGTLDAEGPNDDYTNFFMRGTFRPSDFFDGNWHTIRWHVRLGSPDIHEWWVDGVYQGLATGNTTASALLNVVLGKNMNQGPLSGQSYNWGRILIYTADPNW